MNDQVVSHVRIYTLLSKLYGVFQWEMMFFGVVLLYCRWCWADFLFAPVNICIHSKYIKMKKIYLCLSFVLRICMKVSAQ